MRMPLLGKSLQDAQQVSAALRVVHGDVDLGGSEGGPEQLFLAVLQRGHLHRQARARPVDGQQIGFGGALRKDRIQGQKQAGIGRGVAVRRVVQKLRRAARHVVDDHIAHDVEVGRQVLDVAPASQSRVDLGVVDRVEAGVGAVDGMEERQQVHAAEDLTERAARAQQAAQALQVLAVEAATEAIDVGDQLDLVLHDFNSDGEGWGVVCTRSIAIAAQTSRAPARRITWSGRPPSRL